MSPEILARVEDIYHRASSLSDEERHAFLAAECDTDEIRKEVESLLSFDDSTDDVIQAPLSKLAAEIVHGDLFDPSARGFVGQYKLLSLIGRGGMGEVFLAEDTILKRKAALKFLPDRFSEDSDRIRRFELEAQSISALNHPNIVTIYNVGNDNGRHYIVTEYIDGQTLREVIRSSDLDVAKILDLAIQIASALEAAHSNGIVHRDIKPENIIVRPDGLLKILDFGVAKLTEDSSEKEFPSTFQTEPGKIIGTRNYMSPEQALGTKIDFRSDIFSFGVVLYELASGNLPFRADSEAGFYDALLNREPDPMDRSTKEVPAELRNVISKLLEKPVEKRYQSAAQIRTDLLEVRRAVESGIHLAQKTDAQTLSFTKLNLKFAAKITFLMIIATFAAGFSYLALSGRSADGEEFKKAEVIQLTDRSGSELFAQISPDGKTFYYVGSINDNSDIFYQRVGGKNAVNLTADSKEEDTQPAVSPDGELIAFRSDREGGGIFLMGASGESVRRLTNFGYYPAWSPDQTKIVFCQDTFLDVTARSIIPSALSLVDVASGEVKALYAGDAVQPSWSPDGKRIAFWSIDSGGSREIFTIRSDGTGEPVKVPAGGKFNWNPIWSPDGQFLYFASDFTGIMSIRRVKINTETGEPVGDVQNVTLPATNTQHFNFSADGKSLIYVNVDKRKNIYRGEFDQANGKLTGEPSAVTSGSRSSSIVDVSADGKSIAFASFGDKKEDLFVQKIDDADSVRLTDDLFKDRVPRWSPDGRRLVFFSDRTGKYETWMINADGSGLRQISRFEDGKHAQMTIWSPDGDKILINVNNSYPRIIDPDIDWDAQYYETVKPFNNPRAYIFATSWSSDGKKLIGHMGSTDKSIKGIYEYVIDTGEYRLFTNFGSAPVWLGDDRRAVFAHENKILLLDTKTGNLNLLRSAGGSKFDSVAISADNRYLYYSLEEMEADVWVARVGDR